MKMECSQVRAEFDLHKLYCWEVHDALKQVVWEKDNQIEELNLHLTQTKSMESSSNLDDVMDDDLHDVVILNDPYDVGALQIQLVLQGSSVS